MPKSPSKKPSRTAKVTRKAKTRTNAKPKTRANADAKARTKTGGTRKKSVAQKAEAKRAGAKSAPTASGDALERGGSSAARGGNAPVARPAKRSKAARRSLASVVQSALEDMKAQHVSCLDVRHLTSVTDTMFIADGRSDRHVRAVADAVVEKAKQAGYAPIGVEGHEAGEWVLVDLADVIVHVMLPRVREFYKLESLWDINARDEAVER